MSRKPNRSARRRRGRPSWKNFDYVNALFAAFEGRPPPSTPKPARWGTKRLIELLVDISRLNGTDREIAEELNMSYGNFRRRRDEAKRLVERIRPQLEKALESRQCSK
jgi:hypothetical protein